MQRPDRSQIIVLIFFALYFISGLLVYQDFGVSYDEKMQRFTGGVSAKYLVKQFYPSYLEAHPELKSVTDLEDYIDRDYGVVFELPLAIIEKVLGYEEDTAELYKMRHLATFIFYFVGVVFFYRLARKRFGNVYWGLLAALMLILIPRIFADTFYNCKDIIFLATILIGLSALNDFLIKRNWKTAVFFGFAAAMATDVRILGILLPLAAGGLFFWDWIISGEFISNMKKEIKIISLGIISFIFFTILMWPYLWSDPIGHFMFAFGNMSKYRWTGNALFMGETYPASDLPRIYIPVYILITMPLLYIVAFLTGLGLMFRNVIRNKWKLFKGAEQRIELGSFAIFLAPIAAGIILHSVLYDGWRHMYFIIGPFVLIGVGGIHWLYHKWKDSMLSKILLGLVGLQLAVNLFFIIYLHPYQSVYFNVLAGKEYAHNFAMDYWGLSYRGALEYIAETDKRDDLLIHVTSYSGVLNHSMLPVEDRNRMHIIPSDSIAESDYLIGYDPEVLKGTTIEHKLVYEVKAGNTPINWVYKK